MNKISKINGEEQKNSHQKLHKPWTDTSFDHSLNFVIGAIWKIRESPAGICKNFLIIQVDEPLENWQSRFHLTDTKDNNFII